VWVWGRFGRPARPSGRRIHHITSAVVMLTSSSNAPVVMIMRSMSPNWVPMWVSTPNSVAWPIAPLELVSLCASFLRKYSAGGLSWAEVLLSGC
jgi:hypothetical protein